MAIKYGLYDPVVLHYITCNEEPRGQPQLSPSHNSIEPSKVTSRKPRVQTLTLESSRKCDFVFDISLNAVL